VRTVSCCVFDIDDTLYLERDYVRSAFTALDKLLQDRHGIAGFLDAALERSVAWTEDAEAYSGRVIDTSLSALGVEPTPALVATLVEAYRAHKPDIALLDDARGALERARGTRIAVVSDGPAASQRAKCVALGLATWAEPIILTAERCPGDAKPSTRPFEMVQDICRAAPERCAYIADNPLKDFRGPARLGWTTVRVRRPGSLHFRVDSDDDVDLEVTGLAGLWPLLRAAS